MESEILSKLAKKGMKLGSTFDGFVFKHPVEPKNQISHEWVLFRSKNQF